MKTGGDMTILITLSVIIFTLMFIVTVLEEKTKRKQLADIERRLRERVRND